MSYILDALRKADAQRERDPATRGIHAQPVPLPMPAIPARASGMPWKWGTAVAGAGLLGLAAWQLTRPSGPVEVSQSLAGRTTQPAVTAVLPPPLAQPVPPPPSATPAATVLPAAPAPLPPPPVAAPATAARGARLPAASSAALPAASAPSVASTPPVAVASTAGRLLTVSELPADVQKDLPKLALSGGVYSENPAQRMLIVNGQVFNEGSEPTPGVVLEQIRARTAVLRYRGYRYAVPY